MPGLLADLQQGRPKQEKVVRQETRVARVHFGLTETGTTALL